MSEPLQPQDPQTPAASDQPPPQAGDPAAQQPGDGVQAGGQPDATDGTGGDEA